MRISSKEALIHFLRGRSFRAALDAPSGDGWLATALGPHTVVDGIDLYVESLAGYRRLWRHDLDDGLPADCASYDLICCCEGLEHLGNPLLFLRHCHRALEESGLLIVTTPNVWYPQARLQYLLRGFFPSFPPLAGKVVRGTHMHITPWSFPQLYIYLRLAGFTGLRIVTEPLSRPKHFHERLLGFTTLLYCRHRFKKASSDEEREFWRTAATTEALMGRHLIVTATKGARG